VIIRLTVNSFTTLRTSFNRSNIESMAENLAAFREHRSADLRKLAEEHLQHEYVLNKLHNERRIVLTFTAWINPIGISCAPLEGRSLLMQRLALWSALDLVSTAPFD
jgi:hypothetical protein